MDWCTRILIISWNECQIVVSLNNATIDKHNWCCNGMQSQKTYIFSKSCLVKKHIKGKKTKKEKYQLINAD